MPRVYLPLASAKAFGAVGEMVVFQGVSARSYVVPYDPRTALQVDQRSLFHDVTKMETSFGPWAKAAWKTAFGSRWYTGLYKRVTENGRARFETHAAVWNAFTESQKEAWNIAATFQVTNNAPGLVFYIVLAVMADWLLYLNAPMYDFSGVSAGGAAAAGLWARKDLSGALTSGIHQQTDTLINYSGIWTNQNNASASGGSYKESAVSGSPFVSFYFYGTQLTFVHMKNMGLGTVRISSFGMVDMLVDLANATQLWLYESNTPILTKSLHFVTITREGTGAANLDALVVSAKNKKTTTNEIIYAAVTLPICRLSRISNQVYPFVAQSGAFSVVEWETGLDNTGMHESTINPGRVTAKVAGYYYVGVALKWQWAQTFTKGVDVELRKNGTSIRDMDIDSTTLYKGEFSRAVWLDIGDYLEVWARLWKVGGTETIGSIIVEGDRYPLFEVFLMQRETLSIGTVNVTVN